MHFAVGSHVRDFEPVFGKLVFPVPVPLRFIFPPRIAVVASFMCPVMYHARPAFGERAAAALRAYTSPTRECFAPHTINECKLHRSSVKCHAELFNRTRSPVRVCQGTRKGFHLSASTNAADGYKSKPPALESSSTRLRANLEVKLVRVNARATRLKTVICDITRFWQPHVADQPVADINEACSQASTKRS